jgi:uncharacterized DUF497 family protein
MRPTARRALGGKREEEICRLSGAAAVINNRSETPFERSRYEWDETKRRTNIEKHGIDFLDAIEAFTDPQGYVYRSRREPKEARLVAVGLVKGTLAAVIFTERGERVRIISARAARRSERRQYG